MAFDTIGITAFNYRFNQFYSKEPHDFQRQMTYVLTETALRRGRLSIENRLRYARRKEMLDDVHAMWDLCDEIVAERKAHPKPEVDDLLNTMLYHKDPKTGEGLSDELIRFQMVTFLVSTASHAPPRLTHGSHIDCRPRDN
jgi:cytochrome P450/NADPH-cytochrome P450 reductase